MAAADRHGDGPGAAPRSEASEPAPSAASEPAGTLEAALHALDRASESRRSGVARTLKALDAAAAALRADEDTPEGSPPTVARAITTARAVTKAVHDKQHGRMKALRAAVEREAAARPATRLLELAGALVRAPAPGEAGRAEAARQADAARRGLDAAVVEHLAIIGMVAAAGAAASALGVAELPAPAPRPGYAIADGDGNEEGQSAAQQLILLISAASRPPSPAAAAASAGAGASAGTLIGVVRGMHARAGLVRSGDTVAALAWARRHRSRLDRDAAFALAHEWPEGLPPGASLEMALCELHVAQILLGRLHRARQDGEGGDGREGEGEGKAAELVLLEGEALIDDRAALALAFLRCEVAPRFGLGGEGRQVLAPTQAQRWAAVPRFGRLAGAVVWASGSPACGGLLGSPYSFLGEEASSEAAATELLAAMSWALGVRRTSALADIVRAGQFAVQPMLQLDEVCRRTGGVFPHLGAAAGGIEAPAAYVLPIEVPLPRDLQFHSVFICPVSRQPSDSAVMLSCGHVLGAAAAASLFEARGNKTKCFTCAVVTTKENAVTLVLG